MTIKCTRTTNVNAPITIWIGKTKRTMKINESLWNDKFDLTTVYFDVSIRDGGDDSPMNGTDAQCVVEHMRRLGYQAAFIISDGQFPLPKNLDGLDIKVLITPEPDGSASSWSDHLTQGMSVVQFDYSKES